MTTALIGYSGFVGSTLMRQTSFDDLYRSTNIEDIRGKEYDLVVCAGAPAQKWAANLDPAADLARLRRLMLPLADVNAKRFVLISTVDVFANPVMVDEDTPVLTAGLHAYGQHRRMLEEHVSEHFAGALIVRLPGLVGPGLRKNAVFDFLNHNELHKLDCRAQYQFYPTVNLWADLQTAMRRNLQLVHLTAAPLTLRTVAEEGYGALFTSRLASVPARYDVLTKHARAFGGGIGSGYTYSGRESVLAIRAYAQSEPKLAVA